jgi:hypothetical protein
MTRYALTLLVLLGFFGAPLLAQAPVQTPAPSQVEATQPPIVERRDAEQTRQELLQLLREHPPSVSVVLRNDPSLANPQYLAPYPGLLDFVQRHPEVSRNPSYFFGSPDARDGRIYLAQPADRSVQMFNDIMEGFTIMLVAGAIIGTFTWLIRFFIDHRRWLRVSKTQAEVHTKLLDRLTSHEDLMSYIQTPAGRRFLESAPIALDEKPKSIGAPMSRILWSMQAGVVLASLGIGFFMAQTRFPEDMGEGFYIMGMLVAWLGIGFGASAALAYVISSRFGLVAPPRPSTTND